MSGLPETVFNRWRHSFEEDSENTLVYRLPTRKLPLARGRDEFEFHRDGTYLEWVVGRGDRREPVHGRWELRPDGCVQITFEQGPRTRTLELVNVGPDVLGIRQVQP